MSLVKVAFRQATIAALVVAGTVLTGLPVIGSLTEFPVLVESLTIGAYLIFHAFVGRFVWVLGDALMRGQESVLAPHQAAQAARTLLKENGA